MHQTNTPNPQLPIIVMLAGNIGIGKAEVATMAAQQFDWGIHIDTVTEKNPWLRRFYKDMKRWAFHSQMFFLDYMAQSYSDILNQTNQNVIILDHCPPFEIVDVFTQNLAHLGYLDEDEWQLFQNMYSKWRNSLRPPDLLVYLYTSSIKILQQRMNGQGLIGRRKIKTIYLEQLDAYYTKMVSRFDPTLRIEINVDRLELNDPTSFEAVLDRIKLEVDKRMSSLFLDS